MIRIKPNQILCTITECGKEADYSLHRYLGPEKPARLAYCKDHAREVARDLSIRLPDSAG